MTSKSSLTAGLTILLIFAACGGTSESGTPAPKSEQAPVEVASDNSFSEAGWAIEVRVAVADLQSARGAAADQFDFSWRLGPDELDAQRALYEADSDSLDDLLSALAERPPTEPLTDRFDMFLRRTMELRSDADRIAAALIENESELRSLLVNAGDPASLGHPALTEIIGDHASYLDSWRIACFDLQAAISATGLEPIDCVGVERADGDTNPDVVDSSLVDVSLTCIRGETMDELPYDRSVYAFQANLATDTAWIRSVVTIVNRSDDPVQVQTNFQVRYDDIDGEKILEADWTESWEPAFHVQPGQTIYRTGYAFDGLTFARPIRGEEISAGSIAEVFARLETCVVVEEPGAVVAAAEPFIDHDWVPQLDLVDCGSDPETGRYEGTALIGNPGELPVRVLGLGFEILDASGTRLGMGGSDGTISIEPGGNGEVTLWSVLYTITDVDDVQSCRLVELIVEQ